MTNVTKMAAEEAVYLSKFLEVGDIGDAVAFAQDICREETKSKVDFSFLDRDLCFALAALYNAGKIQGIREERARRKGAML